jgi:hypothetical protein
VSTGYINPGNIVDNQADSLPKPADLDVGTAANRTPSTSRASASRPTRHTSTSRASTTALRINNCAQFQLRHTRRVR